MTDNRLELAGQCLRVLRELLESGELLHSSFGLTEPDSITFQAQLASGEELATELYLASPPNPLDMACSIFDWMQDYLAERRQPPSCLPGWARPSGDLPNP